MNDAGDVVARVERIAQFRTFPVFGIRARDDHFDSDFVIPRYRDGRVNDLDLGAFVDNRFLHVGRYVLVWVKGASGERMCNRNDEGVTWSCKKRCANCPMRGCKSILC